MGQKPPPPPCAVHARIRSTSGRYASYWNAILLENIFRKCELTMHFKHEMIGKWKEKISQKLRIKWKFELTVFELTVPDLYGLFPLPDSDSDSDSKPYGYIVSLTSTWIRIPFPNGYCTHFRGGSPSQGQISVPVTYISIRGSESESEPMEKYCIVQESVSESESKSESCNGNKPLHTRVTNSNAYLVYLNSLYKQVSRYLRAYAHQAKVGVKSKKIK